MEAKTAAGEQVAVQIRRAVAAGNDKISIRLHPAELGRVMVKLEVSEEGHIRAMITAERAETLDLMQRDTRELERALQSAGLKTDSGSLSFSLRDQGEQEAAETGKERGSGEFEGQGTDPADDGTAETRHLYWHASDDRVDIRI